MKKIILTIAAFVAVVSASAQHIYEMERFSTTDLNGTARFVGMGGAMNALGADLTTLSTNPAGIGLYRKGDAALTGSITMQPEATSFAGIGKTRASFDQAGVVAATNVGGKSLKYINFGFNYLKRKNLKNFIGLDNISTGGLSQSYQMLDLAWDDVNNDWHDLVTEEGRNFAPFPALMGYDTYRINPAGLDRYDATDASAYTYRRVQWGGVYDYDFNLSFNWFDQIYAGATLGVHSVDMHSALDYGEWLEAGGDYYFRHDQTLTGSGIDAKFGLIVRPVEDNPFRIGLSFHTPTFYSVVSDAYAYAEGPDLDLSDGSYASSDAEVYGREYKIRTPWKVNVALGTTVGTTLAVDAEYEYSNLPTARTIYADDYWGGRHIDEGLATEAEACLRGVHTFRMGAEVRVSSQVFVRAGYNFVSAPMKSDAFLNLFADSPSYYYNMGTDYVNLGATQRATLGLGYRGKHFYADLAYQYQTQAAEVFPFHAPAPDDNLKNRLQGQKIDLKRNNFMLTLGYKF